MRKDPCSECQELIDGKVNSRHSNLERSGLYRSIGFHGNRDDEHYYKCKVCSTIFIGDSCGTWQEK